MADAGFKPQKEINRIKVQVRKLEKDKDRMFPELGRLTYQEYIEGKISDQAVEEACARIKAIDAQVEEANANIAVLQAQAQQMKAAPPPRPAAAGVSCPSCGAPADPGVRFCGNCGAELTSQAPPAAPASACPSCGKAVAPGTRFCGNCGSQIAAAPAAPPVPPPPPAPAAAPPAQAAPPPPPPPPAQEPAASSAPTPPPPPPAAGSPDTAEAGPALKCPSCGAAVEEEGAAFCGECGAKL